MRKIYILQSVASIFHPLSHPCSPILSPQGNSHNESKLSRLQLLVLSSTFESLIHWTTRQEIISSFMGQMSAAKIPGYKSWPCYKFSSSSPDSPQICSVRLSSPSTALIGDNPLTEIPLPPPNSPLLVTTNGSMSKLWHDTHHQFKANRISENRYPSKLFALW